jgi:hypothetical protein
MVSSESDDYELMPKQEIDELRREVGLLKKDSLVEGDKGKILIESIDRLTISVNRLITILDDAQQDIIDEYQQSKPVEKLNQLLDQNEMIAKALVAISDNLNGNSGRSGSLGSSFNSNNNSDSMVDNSGMPIMPPAPSGMGSGNISGTLGTNSNNPRSIMSGMNNQNINNQGMNSQYGQQMNPQMMNMRPPQGMGQMNQMSPQPMDDLPPMDSIPPLNGQMPAQKKKFLGIM